MWSTCLFCHASLGSNEVVERFPIGRRLAFDSAKGRLWVVCRKCERWNLTPVEERWEAVEECERRFREARLRVSTDNIGVARLREGLELVRIGEPQRPELAAWRYGDQFGRRRRRHVALIGLGAATIGGIVIAGPVLGLLPSLGFPVWNGMSGGIQAINRARTIARVPLSPGIHAKLNQALLDHSAIVRDASGELKVVVRHRPLDPYNLVKAGVDFHPITAADLGRGEPDEGIFSRQRNRRALGLRRNEALQETTLTGEAARRTLGLLMPRANRQGAGRDDVNRAVDDLVQAGGAEGLLERVGSARKIGMAEHRLGSMPVSRRLALEMALHEDMERAALEGELEVLEEHWREAEEIAGIADNLLAPETPEAWLERKRREDDGDSP